MSNSSPTDPKTKNVKFSDTQKLLIDNELQEILCSEHFENAPIVRTFLEYVVNEYLAGRGHEVKAYTIATEALGRSVNFDPTNDTIVRTTAGRVRKALQSYYETCDKKLGEFTPQVIISLPKGRYIPSFKFQELPPPPVSKSNSQLPHIRQALLHPYILIMLCVFAAIAISTTLLPDWKNKTSSSPSSVVIDVYPVRYVDQKTQPLAQTIDFRLAPALSRIGLAEIIPPSTTHYENGTTPTKNSRDILFALKTSIIEGENPKLLWKLVDANSNHILWADNEPISGMDSVSIGMATDRLAFHVLGIGGAVPLILERYHGKIFTRPTCISRAQIVEAVENNTTYPKMRNCLERIVASSPNDASAWAVLSILYTYRSTFYSVGSHDERAMLVKHAERAAEKAAELSPTSYLTKVALMHLSLRQGRVEDFDKLQQEIRNRYPGDIFLQIRIATRLARLGRGREALEIFDKAQEKFGINLKNWSPGIAVAHFSEAQYERAYHEILRSTSDLRFVLVLKAAILGKLGMKAEAVPIIHQLIKTNPDIRETFYPWLDDIGWTKPLAQEIADGLAKAGVIVQSNPTSPEITQ